MGGYSSKSEHSNPAQKFSKGATHSETVCSEAGSACDRVHEGPVHSICPLDQDTLISGGVDKVYLEL